MDGAERDEHARRPQSDGGQTDAHPDCHSSASFDTMPSRSSAATAVDDTDSKSMVGLEGLPAVAALNEFPVDVLPPVVNAAPSTTAEDEEPGDTTITAGDDDGANGSLEADSSKQSLSTDELLELRQFNEKKAKIEEQYKLLQSRPMPKTFGPLQPMNSSEAAVDAALTELPIQKAELQDWLAEHERIQNEAVAFNVADMNRLRTVAKAAAERHMSPQDTDLIELTVETLVALDKLLLLLNERRLKLDLLAAQLEWEERRAACWKVFHPLIEDIGLFVQKRARWTASVYSRATHKPGDRLESPAASLISHAPTEESHYAPTPPGRRSSTVPAESTQGLLLEALNAELVSLSSRIRELVTEFVPSAGESLDGLIDQCQVPDAYLEEQEVLENLALDMTARGLFITALAAQWRKANELYLATRSLHVNAKELLAEADSVRAQFPTTELYDKLAQSSAALNARLEELAGPTARRFVYNPTQSAHTLVFSSANHIPKPLHDAWEDQVGQNALISTHLDRDLAAAAKRTRQAAMSIESYNRGLGAAQRAEAIQQRLTSHARALEQIRDLASGGFISSAPSTSSMSMSDPGARPDLSSLDCLPLSRHSVYVERLPEEEAKAQKIAADVTVLMEELNKNLATCTRHGLVNASIKDKAAAATKAFQEAQTAAADALTEGSQLVKLLQQARSVNAEIFQLQTSAAQLKNDLSSAMRSPAFSPKAKAWDATIAPRPTGEEAAAKLQSCLQGLAEVDEQLAVFKSLPQISSATAVREKLEADRSRIAEQVTELRALVAWYGTLCQQETSVRKLSKQIGNLRKQAAEIKDWSSNKRKSLPDVSAMQQNKKAFDAAECDFEKRAATETIFTGEPPKKLHVLESLTVPSVLTHKARSASIDLKGKLEASSHDEEVRACVNSWCTEAKLLQEQVAAAVEALEQEVARLKSLAEASSERSTRFDGAVNSALEAVQALSEELTVCETGFNELMSTSGSFGDLRQYRDDSREKLGEKEQVLGSRLDALRECQREMISSMYSTGKPVVNDSDSSSTASAVKVRNAASSTVKTMRKTLARFDDILTQTTAGRRSMSTSFSKTEVAGDDSVGDVSQDVFGPRQSVLPAQVPKAVPTSVDYDGLVQSLRNDELDAQTVEDGLPQLAALLDFPTPVQDEHVQSWWARLRPSFQDSLQQPPSPGRKRMAAAIELRERSVVRHGQLTNFHSKATDLEQAVSALLNLLDFNGGRSTTSSMENLSGLSSRATSPYLATLDQIEPMQQRLVTLLNDLRSIAEPTISDARVTHRLGQLTRATKDVLADAKEFGKTPDVSVAAADALLDDAESVASTVSSATSSLASVEEEDQLGPMPAPASAYKTPEKTGNLSRSSMGPPAAHARRPSTLIANGLPSTPVHTSSRRSVSDQTPGSTKLPTRLRRLRSSIAPPQTPQPAPAPRVPASPRTGTSRLPVRTPSSEYKRKAPTMTPQSQRYRANPKSKLDVAVGKIVNHLPVSVKVAHASTGPNARKQDTWKDESGRYWIGDPEPKLCFCRILRSRTVMVRVGGGWQELSSYITQHYSHLAAASVAFPVSPSAARIAPGSGTSPNAVRLNTGELPWISSSTMTRSSTLEIPPAVVLTPADEDRRFRLGSIDPDVSILSNSRTSHNTSTQLTPSQPTTPARAVSPSTFSPLHSPNSSQSAAFGTIGEELPNQRLRKKNARQSLDISVLMPRLPSSHAANSPHRTPSPSGSQPSSNLPLRSSPARSPLHLRTGSLGPITTPQRPLYAAGKPSPEGMLPFFIRKESSIQPYRSVSGSSRS